MYIRTKDGRIIAFGKEYAYPTRIVKGNQRYIFTELTEATFEKMKEFNHWEILNQSENLEGLCDEFVFNSDISNYVIDKKFIELTKAIILKIYKENDETDYVKAMHPKFYGAIWVDGKGLIYVAKMDNEGKLVLI